MKHAYFVTGTDTEIGKTFITCALLARARQLGLSALGLKPVAAGTDAEGKNEDVEQIRAANSLALSIAEINPYCFAPAIAPHLAAVDACIDIDFDVIGNIVTAARQRADFVVVEGAGGFLVPLAVDRNSADLVTSLQLPLILVVGMRLGCLNHALLTVEAIAARGLPLAGWVANRIDPAMARFDDNLASLKHRIAAPLLGVMPHAPATPADWLRLPGEPGFAP
jgi:dethiobiotin synthetase